MCPLGIETILGSHWHFTLFITFQAICYFHSQSQPFASSTIYSCYLYNQIAFSPSTINFLNLYLNLYLLHAYCLVTSFLPLKCVCKCETFILQWEKKINTKCHTKHLESMIEYTLISRILDRICEMTKNLLEYPRDDTKLDPL
jgi:hypothetical protein